MGTRVSKTAKCFLVIMVSIIYTLSIGIVSVNADRSDVDSIAYVGINQAAISSICSSANEVAGVEILVYTGNDGMLSFSNKNYTSLDVATRRDFMETALIGVKESNLGTKVKNKVYNFISDQDSTSSAAVKYLRSDASADFAGAMAWVKPSSSVFGVILGVLSILIFMLIGLSILFDSAYMVLPGFRVFVEKGESDNRPRFITRECYSSVKEAEESIKGNDYKNCMSTYFKRRVPSIVIMAIALGYLISGQIYDIFVFFIDSFSWMFNR